MSDAMADIVVTKLRTGGLRLAAIVIDDHTVLAIGDEAVASSDGKRFHEREHLERVGALLVHDGAIYAAGKQLGVSRDRGATWTPIEVPDITDRGHMTCIHRHSNGTWMIGGYGGIIVSKSPRKGWQVLRQSHKVSEISEHFGRTYVVGYENGVLEGDELIPFIKQKTVSSIEGIIETPAGTLLTYGEDLVRHERHAVVYRSVDRGKTWKPVELPRRDDTDLHAGTLVGGAIYLVGAGNLVNDPIGVILRSTDDGKTFEPVAGAGDRRLWAIASWGDGAMICGEGGTILKLARPEDPYWHGTVDTLAPPPLVADAAFAPPTPRDPAMRETTFARLLAEAETVRAAAAAKLPALVRTDIERARDDDDSDDVIAVHVDSLEGPRGELAAIQVRRAAKPRDKKLIATERALFETHRAALLGKLANLAGNELVTLEWRGGFVDRARIGWSFELEDAGGSVGELASALLADPSARFLRAFTVGVVDIQDNTYVAIAKALGRAARPSLRSLSLGDFDETMMSTSGTDLGNLEPIWAATPSLQTLRLHGGEMKLGKIVLPRVETVSIVNSGVDRKAAKALAAARWPSLRSFSITIEGGDVTLEDLAPILTGETTPRLTELGLPCFGDHDAIAMLATSNLLPQLAKLTLSAHVTDAGAKAIVRLQRAFAHLETLVLESVSRDAKKLLAKARLPLACKTVS